MLLTLALFGLLASRTLAAPVRNVTIRPHDAFGQLPPPFGTNGMPGDRTGQNLFETNHKYVYRFIATVQQECFSQKLRSSIAFSPLITWTGDASAAPNPNYIDLLNPQPVTTLIHGSELRVSILEDTLNCKVGSSRLTMHLC